MRTRKNDGRENDFGEAEAENGGGNEKAGEMRINHLLYSFHFYWVDPVRGEYSLSTRYCIRMTHPPTPRPSFGCRHFRCWCFGWWRRFVPEANEGRMYGKVEEA